MEPDEIRAACELLYRHWSDGTRLEALPPQLRPTDRAEAYRVQACIEEFSPAPLYGWKIAATSVAGQRHIGVDGPLAGRLLAERIIADGGTCVLGSNLMRVAELEFAFRMADDLTPRTQPFSQDDVLTRVATLHPAIELPDSRFEHFGHAGSAQHVADNACAHRFVLGPPTNVDWRSLDLAAHPGRVMRNGVLAGEGVGRNVLGDPRIALTWLANELSRHGVTLKAGQVVITGTCVKPLAICAGDRIEGDLDILGRVSVTIV